MCLAALRGRTRGGIAETGTGTGIYSSPRPHSAWHSGAIRCTPRVVACPCDAYAEPHTPKRTPLSYNTHTRPTSMHTRWHAPGDSDCDSSVIIVRCTPLCASTRCIRRVAPPLSLALISLLSLRHLTRRRSQRGRARPKPLLTHTSRPYTVTASYQQARHAHWQCSPSPELTHSPTHRPCGTPHHCICRRAGRCSPGAMAPAEHGHAPPTHPLAHPPPMRHATPLYLQAGRQVFARGNDPGGTRPRAARCAPSWAGRSARKRRTSTQPRRAAPVDSQFIHGRRSRMEELLG